MNLWHVGGLVAKVAIVGMPMAVILVIKVILFQESRFWELKQFYELFSCHSYITYEDFNFLTGIAL